MPGLQRSHRRECRENRRAQRHAHCPRSMRRMLRCVRMLVDMFVQMFRRDFRSFHNRIVRARNIWMRRRAATKMFFVMRPASLEQVYFHTKVSAVRLDEGVMGSTMKMLVLH